MKYKYEVEWDHPDWHGCEMAGVFRERMWQTTSDQIHQKTSNRKHCTQEDERRDAIMPDPSDDSDFYNTPLRQKHQRADYDRVRKTLDPGYFKFKDFGRSQQFAADSIEARERKRQRALKYAAKKRKIDLDALTEAQKDDLLAAHEADKRVRSDNAAMVQFLMDVYGYSQSGAYKKLGGLNDDEKDSLKSEAREAGYGDDPDEADAPGHECQRSNQPSVGPLPATEDVQPHWYPDHVIPDKAAIRAQLEADTERFLAGGGEIKELPYRGDPKPLPFNKW